MANGLDIGSMSLQQLTALSAQINSRISQLQGSEQAPSAAQGSQPSDLEIALGMEEDPEMGAEENRLDVIIGMPEIGAGEEAEVAEGPYPVGSKLPALRQSKKLRNKVTGRVLESLRSKGALNDVGDVIEGFDPSGLSKSERRLYNKRRLHQKARAQKRQQLKEGLDSIDDIL